MSAVASGLLGDPSRDEYLTDFGKATLSDRYVFTGESYQDVFTRVANAYADDFHHAYRLYDYMSHGWFLPATPILSNGGTTRGLPISCFLNAVPDSLEGIRDTWNENVMLAARGGGIGTYWGGVRSIGEKIDGVGQTSGIIPFIKVQDSLTLAISQGSLRRGSAAVYLHISHPEIETFVKIRKPAGDFNRQCLNIHHGVVISDAFMEAVLAGKKFPLVSPKDGSVIKTVDARTLFKDIMEMRLELGEPYIVFGDTVNASLSPVYRANGLSVKQSNLCSEIMLHTGEDQFGKTRTAVCCLASTNLTKFDEWGSHPTFIEDVMRFLDNVLQDFIDRTDGVPGFENARYSAIRERSVGLGAMGFHSFLQSQSIPYEGVMAKVWNEKIFKHLKTKCDDASRKLAEERGPCPDAADVGLQERFAHKMAIAPTSSISIICPGNPSPGVEPWVANIFTHKTLSGSFTVKNPHLDALLRRKVAELHPDDAEVAVQASWASIIAHDGSVQQLDVLDDHEKAVYKTAFELDQSWVVDHGGDRAQYLDQGQSLNVFLPGNVDKTVLLQLHVRAWRKKNKALYYLRSKATSRAEKIVDVALPTPSSEECLVCQ